MIVVTCLVKPNFFNCILFSRHRYAPQRPWKHGRIAHVINHLFCFRNLLCIPCNLSSGEIYEAPFFLKFFKWVALVFKFSINWVSCEEEKLKDRFKVRFAKKFIFLSLKSQSIYTCSTCYLNKYFLSKIKSNVRP